MFWVIIKENKWSVLLTSVLGILVSILLVRMALMLSGLIDYAVAKDLTGLIRLGIFYLISWVIVIGLNYLSDLSEAKTIQKINESLRKNMTDKIVSLDYETYYQVDSGTYISWLTNDLNQIEENSFRNLFSMITNLTVIISSLFALWTTSILVAGLSIVLCLIMMIVPWYLNRKVQKRATYFSKSQESFVTEIKTTLLGYDVLYSYNLLSQLKQAINKQSHQVEQVKYKFKETKSYVNGIMTLIQILSLFSNIILIGILATLELTTIGMVLPVTELSGNVFRSFSSLMTSWTNFKSSNPLLEKYEIQLEDQVKMPCPNFKQAIEFKNVSYAYDEKMILNQVSLRFEKGKKYVIVGPSGSGKTTLIKLILGQLSGYEGNIYFDGTNVALYSGESLRQQIAYISQNVYLFNETLKENILLHQSLEDSCLSEFTQQKDMLIGENGSRLSGGQKQRIAVARALIRQKPIIILDEGTSALDQQNAFEIESKLLNHQDLTVIMITHHLNPVLMNQYDEVIDLGMMNKVKHA